MGRLIMVQLKRGGREVVGLLGRGGEEASPFFRLSQPSAVCVSIESPSASIYDIKRHNQVIKHFRVEKECHGFTRFRL